MDVGDVTCFNKTMSFPIKEKNFAVSNSCFPGGVLRKELDCVSGALMSDTRSSKKSSIACRGRLCRTRGAAKRARLRVGGAYVGHAEQPEALNNVSLAQAADTRSSNKEPYCVSGAHLSEGQTSKNLSSMLSG